MSELGGERANSTFWNQEDPCQCQHLCIWTPFWPQERAVLQGSQVLLPSFEDSVSPAILTIWITASPTSLGPPSICSPSQTLPSLVLIFWFSRSLCSSPGPWLPVGEVRNAWESISCGISSIGEQQFYMWLYPVHIELTAASQGWQKAKRKKKTQQKPHNCVRRQIWQGKESNQAAFFKTMSKNGICRALSNFKHKS